MIPKSGSRARGGRENTLCAAHSQCLSVLAAQIREFALQLGGKLGKVRLGLHPSEHSQRGNKALALRATSPEWSSRRDHPHVAWE
jgi:hypothetical protein